MKIASLQYQPWNEKQRERVGVRGGGGGKEREGEEEARREGGKE